MSQLQVLKILFKERYKDSTLQLIIPTMIVGYIFIPAFLEKGDFEPYSLVISFTPIISLSETIAFSLSLRNIIFVLGDHLTNGSIVSFLMMPVKRITFFFYSYFLDVVLPYLFWVATNYFYLADIGCINPLTNLLSLTYTAGYFFSTAVILFLTLFLKSNGASTLASMFALGSIFLVGGFGNYSLVQNNSPGLSITSFMNPYPLLLAYSFKQSSTLLSFIYNGIAMDFVLALILILVSLFLFKRIEV